MTWCTREEIEWSMDSSIIRYFDDFHKTGAYNPATQQGWLSIFKAYWLHNGKGDLCAKVPILQGNLTKWSKKYRPNKAATLSREHILLLLRSPDTPCTLAWKIYVIIMLHIAGRSCETTYLKRDSLTKLVQSTGEINYKLAFRRKKINGPIEDGYALITGKDECEIIER